MAKIPVREIVVPHPFIYTFGVPLKGNKTSFKLEQNSRVHNYHLVGIQVRRTEAESRSVDGNPLVRKEVYAASFLTLKQRNVEVGEKIPLENIIRATEYGEWYPIDLPNVDMAQSNVLCTNAPELATSQTNGEEYEFSFKYIQYLQQTIPADVAAAKQMRQQAYEAIVSNKAHKIVS